jgi:3-dehydrosphinganine reductase
MRPVVVLAHDARALITGGSLGIGLALAEQCAREGRPVTLVARRRGPLEDARRAILAQTPGAKVDVLELDVSDEARVQAELGAELAARPAALIINNAGESRPGRFTELEPAEFRRHMDINFHSAVAVTRVALPHLLAARGGHVVNVGSLAGAIGVYGLSAYTASKFALHGFSECLRAELAPLGIGVSLVLPPDTDTPMLAGEQPYLPAETRAITGTVRTLTAAEVARQILRGVARGDFEIVPSLEARWTLRLARMFPGVQRWYLDARARRVS